MHFLFILKQGKNVNYKNNHLLQLLALQGSSDGVILICGALKNLFITVTCILILIIVADRSVSVLEDHALEGQN